MTSRRSLSPRGSGYHGLQGIIGAVAICLMLLWPAHAQADLIVQLPPILSVTPGSSGSFDVLLTNTNPAGGASYDVAGFSLGVEVLGSGVNFTNVDTSTTTPYIFGTLQVPPFTFDTLPSTSVIVSDAFFSPPFFVTVAPGASFGLAHVSYAADANAEPGSRDLQLIPDATSIATNAAVPLPSTAASVVASLAALGLGSTLGRRRCR